MTHGKPLMMPRLSVKFNKICFGTFLFPFLIWSTVILMFYQIFRAGNGVAVHKNSESCLFVQLPCKKATSLLFTQLNQKTE